MDYPTLERLMASWRQRKKHRYEAICRKMANMRSAKERKRMEAHRGEPPPAPSDPRPLWIITVQGRVLAALRRKLPLV